MGVTRGGIVCVGIRRDASATISRARRGNNQRYPRGESLKRCNSL